jgi:hypothetical protein
MPAVNTELTLFEGRAKKEATGQCPMASFGKSLRRGTAEQADVITNRW